MKRQTVNIFDQFLHAWDLLQVLQKAGIDSKLVTKHAVQIHPEELEKAKQVCAEEKVKREMGTGVVKQ